MRLDRPKPSRLMISVVSMIDVLMILLIFFMVTSSYLDLGMVPMAERADEGAGSAPDNAKLLIRLDAAGTAIVQGRALAPVALAALLGDRLAADPALTVIVLPSGLADAQALVGVMDLATQAGVTRVQVLRLEAGP